MQGQCDVDHGVAEAFPEFRKAAHGDAMVPFISGVAWAKEIGEASNIADNVDSAVLNSLKCSMMILRRAMFGSRQAERCGRARMRTPTATLPLRTT